MRIYILSVCLSEDGFNQLNFGKIVLETEHCALHTKMCLVIKKDVAFFGIQFKLDFLSFHHCLSAEQQQQQSAHTHRRPNSCKNIFN